jgi:hypothetical protein
MNKWYKVTAEIMIAAEDEVEAEEALDNLLSEICADCSDYNITNVKKARGKRACPQED